MLKGVGGGKTMSVQNTYVCPCFSAFVFVCVFIGMCVFVWSACTLLNGPYDYSYTHIMMYTYIHVNLKQFTQSAPRTRWW